jgi:blocked early in transport 1
MNRRPSNISGGATMPVHAQSNAEMLEEQNDRLVGALGEKVKRIKEFSQQIHIEIEQSNLLIDDVSQHMGGASGLLDGALNRLKLISEDVGGRNTLYLALFVVAIFVVLWFLT